MGTSGREGGEEWGGVGQCQKTFFWGGGFWRKRGLGGGPRVNGTAWCQHSVPTCLAGIFSIHMCNYCGSECKSVVQLRLCSSTGLASNPAKPDHFLQGPLQRPPCCKLYNPGFTCKNIPNQLPIVRLTQVCNVAVWPPCHMSLFAALLCQSLVPESGG